MNEIEKSGRRAVAIQANSADAAAVRGAVAKTVDIWANRRRRRQCRDFAAQQGGCCHSRRARSNDRHQHPRRFLVHPVRSAAHEGWRPRHNDRVEHGGTDWNGGSKRLPILQGCGRSDGERLALDLAPRRITVNNIQPGPTDTDMNAGAIEMLSDRSPLKRCRPQGNCGNGGLSNGSRHVFHDRIEPDNRRRLGAINSALQGRAVHSGPLHHSGIFPRAKVCWAKLTGGQSFGLSRCNSRVPLSPRAPRVSGITHENRQERSCRTLRRLPSGDRHPM